MTDALVDKYPNTSNHPGFATFGNPQNTYTHTSLPQRIDYIMFWSTPNISMKTADFIMPRYTTLNSNGKILSLSDHEALHANFLIKNV